MKAENEKKNVHKSIKMTKEQAEQVQSQADAQNMSFSSYVVDKLIHAESQLTPEVVVIVQEIVNQALNNVAEETVRSNIEKECNKLWALLK